MRKSTIKRLAKGWERNAYEYMQAYAYAEQERKRLVGEVAYLRKYIGYKEVEEAVVREPYETD